MQQDGKYMIVLNFGIGLFHANLCPAGFQSSNRLKIRSQISFLIIIFYKCAVLILEPMPVIIIIHD